MQWVKGTTTWLLELLGSEFIEVFRPDGPTNYGPSSGLPSRGSQFVS